MTIIRTTLLAGAALLALSLPGYAADPKCLTQAFIAGDVTKYDGKVVNAFNYDDGDHFDTILMVKTPDGLMAIGFKNDCAVASWIIDSITVKPKT